MPLISYTPVYTPKVSYRNLYYTKFAEKSPREMMSENLKYALKIADKLYDQEKYSEAKHYYNEAILLGGNSRMISLTIDECDRRMNYHVNKKNYEHISRMLGI